MTDAYEAWLETKAHLTEEPDSTFLRTVEESLRPAALLDFLGSFRGLNGSEEPLGCEPDEAAEFLADLDEIRAPAVTQHNAQLEGMRVLVHKTLADMRTLNWTGEHTYGDALQDVTTVLLAVLAGEPEPKLERFRCPSLRKMSRGTVQCELQLPHETRHIHGPFGWTDEQAANPPKNYDEPCGATKTMRPGVLYTCDKTAGHGGQHADLEHEKAWNVEPVLTDAQLDKLGAEVFGNLDPINRLQPEDTDGPCGAESSTPLSPFGICIRPKAHTGLHRDEAGMRWGR